jgi:hypothetical protein
MRASTLTVIRYTCDQVSREASGHGEYKVPPDELPNRKFALLISSIRHPSWERLSVRKGVLVCCHSAVAEHDCLCELRIQESHHRGTLRPCEVHTSGKGRLPSNLIRVYRVSLVKPVFFQHRHYANTFSGIASTAN